MKNVGYSTNLDGALSAIFEVAKKEKDSPEALLIVSDSEIDWFISREDYEDIVVNRIIRE